MGGVGVNGDAIVVDGDGSELRYTPRLVQHDGVDVAHESRGGSLSAVWVGQVGDYFVEVAHLGDGPEGGELVMTVTAPELPGVRPMVALGDLFQRETPTVVNPSWPAAVDHALGLLTNETIIVSLDGEPITKDDVEAFHQRLLGVLYA
jgi:hypothetical protein